LGRKKEKITSLNSKIRIVVLVYVCDDQNKKIRKKNLLGISKWLVKCKEIFGNFSGETKAKEKRRRN